MNGNKPSKQLVVFQKKSSERLLPDSYYVGDEFDDIGDPDIGIQSNNEQAHLIQHKWVFY